MKVAITGVSGYLGGLVVRQLEADPEVSGILGLDLRAPKATSTKLTFERADVLQADFASLFAGLDAVIHLAFIVQPPKRMTMETIDRINIEGSRRVFEGALAAGVKKIVYTSSIAAYGAHTDNPAAITEDCPLRPNPDWYYSRTKGKVEELLDDLMKKHPGATVVRLRPSIFVGPGINNAVRTMVRSRALICTNPNLKVDFCWDEDIAEAVRPALHHPRSDVFNLCGGAPLTMPEMGRLLHKPVWRFNPRVVVALAKVLRAFGLLSEAMYEWLAVAAMGEIVVSSAKARRELNWRPRYDAAGALVEFARRIAVADRS